MQRRINNIPPEERFTRTVFGVIMMTVVWFSWGRWVVAVLGALFLVSAWQGYCVTCEAYKKHANKRRDAFQGGDGG